ncbi:DHH family phosphoesterase [Desulfurococcaceae archaeon MEX13E-LK6-19]|nr:DHH family phosphoesterase [Desulfurococcaceae archaeon MEX13E-LK6-19]
MVVRAVLFIHGDSDGICSGALAYHVYSRKYEHVDIVFTHPAGLYEDLMEFASPGDHVFIADIALSEPHLDGILRVFNEFNRRGEIVYIDHHPEPLGLNVKELPGIIIHDTCCSASELVYKYFENQLDSDYTRIALYGAIGDYLDDTPWVKKTLLNWDKRSVYFEAGVLSQGLEASRKMYDFKRHVVKHLADNRLPSSLSELLVRALIESINEEEMRTWVKKNVNILNNIGYVINPPGSLGRAANFARAYSGKKIGLAASVHKNVYVMSLRSDGSIDLNKLLRRLAVKFNGTGGGHPVAAGARIPINKFNDFLRELDREAGEEHA